MATKSPEPAREDTPMSLTLRQIGPCFAAEASGIDITQPITAEQAD